MTAYLLLTLLTLTNTPKVHEGYPWPPWVAARR